jgi:hypothetical protein
MTKQQLLDISKIGIPSEELFHEVCDELLSYKQSEKDLGCPSDVFLGLATHKITEIYIEKNFIEMSGYKDDNFYICRYYPYGKIILKK